MANLFTSQTPSSANNSDGTPGIGTATTVRFAQSGTVTGVRYYATTTVGGTYTAALYQVTSGDATNSGTGTLLASKVGSTPTAGTWNTITFDSSVAVDTTHLYRTVIHNTDGRYVATSSFFGSDLVNGDITADADGDDPFTLGRLSQGTFIINAALAYPTQTFGQASYFVDVEFTAGSSISLTESGSASEATGVSATAGLAESASGADASAAPATVPLSEAGSESAALVPSVTTPLADAASAADVLDNGQTTQVAALDRARGTDLLIVDKRGRATGGSTADGWSTFGALIKANADDLERENAARPTTCPFDGYTLEEARGVLHCVFGGEIFSLTGEPVYDFRI